MGFQTLGRWGIAVVVCLTCVSAHAVDLVLINGNIVTLDEQRPRAEALAVTGNRILAVGPTERIRRHIGPHTRVIDCEKRLVIPGFIEGHGHFESLGRSMMMLRLGEVRSWQQIVDMVADAAADTKPGEWIVGRGWHQSKWSTTPLPNVDGYPTHETLSSVSPLNPVLLMHASGHMSFANTMAMGLAGITEETTDPPGGQLLRDALGRPTGVFRETAQRFVQAAYSRAMAGRSRDDVEAEAQRAIELAMRECLSNGITSFQDAGSNFDTIDRLREYADSGRLQVRLWIMVRDTNAMLERRLAEYRTIGAANDFFTVRAIKCSADGALGAHGAWLLRPYADLRDTTGLNTTPMTVIRRAAELAVEHDYQLCVHAIGDRANREVLDLYEEIFTSSGGPADRRWRIEHAQHLHPRDIPRFAQLGVIASMQGVHCTSDAPYVVKRLGRKRAEQGAYAWRSLLDAGAIVINGTDAPVEDIDPIASFYASVTRRLPDGSEFFPDQRMTRIEALRSYTIDAARAAFEENDKGSLTMGKLADIVVLSHDILTAPDDEIRDAKVDYTIVGGRLMYDRSKEPGQ